MRGAALKMLDTLTSGKAPDKSEGTQLVVQINWTTPRGSPPPPAAVREGRVQGIL